MVSQGRVGPEHASGAAELQIFATGAPTHALSQKPVAVGPGHRLFLAVPRGVAPAAGWPILYMLDGNAAFDHLTPAHLALVPGLAICGVGYDTDRRFSRDQRILDLTPPLEPGAALRPDPAHPGRMAGGAEAFLDRLLGPLRAAAEAGLPIDPARRTLWGHSFGGLFTVFAMLTRPAAFARYAAISPSVWWAPELMGRIAATSTAPATTPLLLALGDAEKRSGSTGPAPDGPAPTTMALLEGLRAQPGITAQLHVLPGHVHIATLPGSFPLALPFALG